MYNMYNKCIYIYIYIYTYIYIYMYSYGGGVQPPRAEARGRVVEALRYDYAYRSYISISILYIELLYIDILIMPPIGHILIMNIDVIINVVVIMLTNIV